MMRQMYRPERLSHAATRGPTLGVALCALPCHILSACLILISWLAESMMTASTARFELNLEHTCGKRVKSPLNAHEPPPPISPNRGTKEFEQSGSLPKNAQKTFQLAVVE